MSKNIILEYGLNKKKKFKNMDEFNNFIFKNKIELYTAYLENYQEILKERLRRRK
jgi:hypothetical protein